jgi:hypothetical protein
MGPKPVISEHGVNFKDGKHDKYIYINDAIELLKAINHEYVEGKMYKYEALESKLTDKEIEDMITSYKPELEETISREITSYKTYLDKEIEDVSTAHPLLNEDEISAFQNNLKIMYDYRIQRAINKIYYMHIIEIISNLIKEHKIKDISTAFNEKFWHIMHTIQGELSNRKSYVATTIKENENATIELEMRF